MQPISKNNSIHRIFAQQLADMLDISLNESYKRVSPFGNKHCQYLDCIIETCRTISTAEDVGAVGRSRSGGSPINVLVTARADLEIDLKLYPP